MKVSSAPIITRHHRFLSAGTPACERILLFAALEGHQHRPGTQSPEILSDLRAAVPVCRAQTERGRAARLQPRRDHRRRRRYGQTLRHDDRAVRLSPERGRSAGRRYLHPHHHGRDSRGIRLPRGNSNEPLRPFTLALTSFFLASCSKAKEATAAQGPPPARPSPSPPPRQSRAPSPPPSRRPARFIADETSDIAPLVAGRVLTTPVNVGDFVKQGQVICELDHRDAQLRLDQARARWIRPPPAFASRNRASACARSGKFDANAVPEVAPRAPPTNRRRRRPAWPPRTPSATRTWWPRGDVSRSAFDKAHTQQETAEAQANAAQTAVRSRAQHGARRATARWRTRRPRSKAAARSSRRPKRRSPTPPSARPSTATSPPARWPPESTSRSPTRSPPSSASAPEAALADAGAAGRAAPSSAWPWSRAWPLTRTATSPASDRHQPVGGPELARLHPGSALR